MGRLRRAASIAGVCALGGAAAGGAHGATADFTSQPGNHMAAETSFCHVQMKQSPYGLPLAVNLPATARIRDVDVTLLFEMGSSNGLRMQVTAPDGTSALIIDRPPTPSFPMTFTIDDEAQSEIVGSIVSSEARRPTTQPSYCLHALVGEPLPTPAPPFTGTTRATFDGLAPAGEWKLYVTNTATEMAIGTAWGLRIEYG